MLASIVIRTYNEERYLNELLTAISEQKNNLVEHEVVIVDSGSTDRTLEIAEKHSQIEELAQHNESLLETSRPVDQF